MKGLSLRFAFRVVYVVVLPSRGYLPVVLDAGRSKGEARFRCHGRRSAACMSRSFPSSFHRRRSCSFGERVVN